MYVSDRVFSSINILFMSQSNEIERENYIFIQYVYNIYYYSSKLDILKESLLHQITIFYHANFMQMWL